MFSVEDLLISHGYKPSRDLPAPREDGPEGRQPARTRTRAGHGLLNGQEDGPAACGRRQASAGRGRVSDREGGRGEPPGPSASGTSEAGFYNQPTSARCPQPQAGSRQACCRRGGREVSSILGTQDREDLEVRGMAQAHSLPGHTSVGPWEVGRRTENVMEKAVWEEELRVPAPAKWQDVSLGSWDQPRKVGRQMSDGSGERLFHDLYPFIQGEHVLSSQNKKKSQSLPRVLSPESLSSVDIPFPLSDVCFPKMPPYPPNCPPHLEPTRHPEKGGASVPLPRPKFGRPLKPPHGSHQPSRGGVEKSDPQDSRQADPLVSRRELCAPDSGLEPPVYVPPPSYRSPPLNVPNPYLEDTAPRPLTEKAGAGGQLPPGALGAGAECGASPRSPRGPPAHPWPAPAYSSCVQYIPFDDPRIRHIRLAQPQGFWEGTELHEKSRDSSPVTPQEPPGGKVQPDGAMLDPRSLTPPSGDGRGPGARPWWLWGQLPGDGERDPCVARGQRPLAGRRHAEGQGSPTNSQGDGACGTQTKLKKFETGIQSKKSSKKKTSETIFCLVSIPVKPDAGPGDAGATLWERRALGAAAGHGQGPREDRRALDLSFLHLAPHAALTGARSWPGLQCRDQQTQTSFPEEPRRPQPLPGAQPGGPSDTAPAPKRPGPALASRDHGQRPNAQTLKGQRSLSPSGNSVLSRTSSSTHQALGPRAGCSQPRVDGRAPRASPEPRPEVVKGEPTGPCNSKQLFGQFLLKPVSRRPWDLISQLESFNKELQEAEQSSDSGGSEDGEAGLQWEPGADARQGDLGFPGLSPERRVEQQQGVRVPEGPACRPGIGEHESQSWRAESGPGRPPSLDPSPAEGGRGDSPRPADRSPSAEKRCREVGSAVNEPGVSPGPVQGMMSSRPSGTKPASPSYPAEPGESQEHRRLPGASISVTPSSAGPAGVHGGRARGTGLPLSLTSKNLGLSAPDLRSVGLSVGQEQSTSEAKGSLGEAGEVPPGESLQARAARILGIEVAVESLLRGSRRAGRSQPPAPDPSACGPERPRDEPSSSSAASHGPTVPNDAFYGRRKCGWTQSPLFVGERDSARRAPLVPEHSGVAGGIASDASCLEPQLRSSESSSFDQQDMGAKPPFRSTLFHFIERTPSVVGSEKRLRSPSKVIESLQEKLASPPRRVDPDRLMRMKEVSSVSRMRFLSFRSADSMEEPEELKAARGQPGPPADFVSLSDGDRVWRVGPSLSVRKEGISRGASEPEDEHVDQDFWCPDAYDPSRVERV
nr:junctional protein associated with coronary artery disease [Microcebus murinus]XP_012644515.1 junctional protein associated with coronary artery disease [Microcebus murinus]XP_012644516.1 junctional protein associated with coronary artery disease [Microcebus murinus]XP_020139697.1 junctional protein associated with coronary artery disease [Microcebus murinus]